MKNMRAAVLSVIAVAAVASISVGAAQAHCFGHCRHHPWAHGPWVYTPWGPSPLVRNHWGYGGLVQTWGLGGPANAPWVGGAVTGVTPYAPYPYDHVRGL